MAAVKDAELMAKGTRREPLLFMNGYTNYLVAVHLLVDQ